MKTLAGEERELTDDRVRELLDYSKQSTTMSDDFVRLCEGYLRIQQENRNLRLRLQEQVFDR